jgi:hypothetical protein
MFVNGAQGDVSPSTGATGGATELDRAQRYGRAVADRALALLAGTRTIVGDSLRISRTGFTQCVTNQLLLLANAVGCMDYDIQGARGCPRTGLLRSMKIASQVAALRLGEEVQVAVVPGEALTRMSIDGGRARRGQRRTSSR